MFGDNGVQMYTYEILSQMHECGLVMFPLLLADEQTSAMPWRPWRGFGNSSNAIGNDGNDTVSAT